MFATELNEVDGVIGVGVETVSNVVFGVEQVVLPVFDGVEPVELFLLCQAGLPSTAPPLFFSLPQS